MNSKALGDQEIQKLVRDIGAYFLDYTVDSDNKKYTDLNDVGNNFSDFAKFAESAKTAQ